MLKIFRPLLTILVTLSLNISLLCAASEMRTQAIAGTYPQLKTTFEFGTECSPKKWLIGERAFGAAGVDGDCKLSKLVARINRKVIDIPQGSYSDLWNVTGISTGYRTGLNALILHVSGGDGADTYEVRLFFIDGVLSFREVPKLDLNTGEVSYMRELIKKKNLNSKRP